MLAGHGVAQSSVNGADTGRGGSDEAFHFISFHFIGTRGVHDSDNS